MKLTKKNLIKIVEMARHEYVLWCLEHHGQEPATAGCFADDLWHLERAANVLLIGLRK